VFALDVRRPKDVYETLARADDSMQSRASALGWGEVAHVTFVVGMTPPGRGSTLPAIDEPERLEFILRRAIGASPVNVLPMAALTKGREGREMTEISFLRDVGAVASRVS